MLRKIRITLALLMFVIVTLLLLDFTGSIHRWLGWAVKIQFLPALMALNFGVVIVLALLTLLLGRIYCSVVCPMGVMQDIIGFFHRKANKKLRYNYSPEKRWLRWGVFAVFVVCLIIGVPVVVTLLAPYSSFGRIVQNLFQPLYILINNGLAAISAHFDSYAFYHRDVWVRSGVTFAVAAATFVIVCILAWRGGRTYCNTICPVGTLLSVLARFSWLKVNFDDKKCIKCGLCARNCKASCIDFKNQTVDYSRCISCGTCMSKCPKDALHYSHPKRQSAAALATDAEEKREKPISETANTSATASTTPQSVEHVDKNRRAFLIGAGVALSATAMAQQKKKLDGGLAPITQKQPPLRNTPITPPGSKGVWHVSRHCTACQLCVAACPNDVLRPSSDLNHFMQPVMSYERGYCRPECTRCSHICPAGAIEPILPSQKSAIQIGHAVWNKKNCVVLTDKVECGNCARHCPVGAISMEPAESLWDGVSDNIPVVPIVNTERCIGCGACEYVCPAAPFSAIYVEGHEQHREI